jgi:hypothetical protein
VRFWSGWGRAFGTNIQTSGITVGFSIMTMHPPTHHSFNNSWLPKTLQWFLTPLVAWPRPLQLFPIPQDEVTAERALFWHNWGDPCRITRGSQHSHIWELPRDAWNHGKHAGITVYMPKGTTSKETVETKSYGKKLFLWSNSRSFG